MPMKRTHILIPDQLAQRIDIVAGKGGRSSFITQATEKELVRHEQMAALKGAAGSWKDENHPELAKGAAKWVKTLRSDYDTRFKKVTAVTRSARKGKTPNAS